MVEQAWVAQPTRGPAGRLQQIASLQFPIARTFTNSHESERLVEAHLSDKERNWKCVALKT